MRIVVTGAAGFIGSHATERLVGRGHHVLGLDSFDETLYPAAPKRRNAAHLAASLGSNAFELVEIDIRDAARVRQELERWRPDVLCHLAAIAGVRPSLEAPARYIEVNLGGTVNLLEASRHLEISRVVFASSSSVYGARGEDTAIAADVEAFKEDDPCLRPASPYAATKRAGELILGTYRDLYGIGVSCLRYFTVYGPRQRPDMAIHKFTTKIAAGEAITMFGDGTTRRDYTFIDDIVSGTVAACERIRPGRFDIYNLGGTGTVSLRQLIDAIAKVVGKPARIEPAPMQPGDVPVTCADITNSARDLDYAPTTALERGLALFWTWLREESQ